jgi:hypothetical protein
VVVDQAFHHFVPDEAIQCRLTSGARVKSSSQALIVIAGYVAAAVVAFIVVIVYVAATDGPERQDSAGMYAFGDSVLFLASFGLAAIPATSAALFFLRSHPSFWRVGSIVALAIAATAVAALVDFLAPQVFGDSHADASSVLSPLRVLFAPLCAIAFFLSGIFAPIRFCRIVFVSAAAVETVVFVWVALLLLRPFQ